METLGYVDTQKYVHCVSPLLYETGRIPFTISMDNGISFPHAGTWLAGEHQALQPTGTSPAHLPAYPAALSEQVLGWGLPRLVPFLKATGTVPAQSVWDLTP